MPLDEDARRRVRVLSRSNDPAEALDELVHKRGLPGLGRFPALLEKRSASASAFPQPPLFPPTP
jgi:hypothetical protein